MEHPEYLAVAGGTAAVFSTRAHDPDNGQNEDSAAVFVIDEQRAVLAVADGAGGDRGGALASGTAIEQLKASLKQHLHAELNLRTCIMDAFENANQFIKDKGIGAATTLAVTELDNGVIRPYHAGDSEIITVGLRGKLKLQTVAHSPVSYAVESGVLDEEEAMEHDDRHLLSNFVGYPEMRIEVGSPLEVARHDTVILASDGLTDNLHTDEIVQIIRKGPLKSAAENLAGEVQHRMAHPEGDHPSKPDDLTFIIFRRRA
jgi:serine/threonine protein phosphatase PrpC